jgi:hypothetical protein
MYEASIDRIIQERFDNCGIDVLFLGNHIVDHFGSSGGPRSG